MTPRNGSEKPEVQQPADSKRAPAEPVVTPSTTPVSLLSPSTSKARPKFDEICKLLGGNQAAVNLGLLEKIAHSKGAGQRENTSTHKLGGRGRQLLTDMENKITDGTLDSAFSEFKSLFNSPNEIKSNDEKVKSILLDVGFPDDSSYHPMVIGKINHQLKQKNKELEAKRLAEQKEWNEKKAWEDKTQQQLISDIQDYFEKNKNNVGVMVTLPSPIKEKTVLEKLLFPSVLAEPPKKIVNLLRAIFAQAGSYTADKAIIYGHLKEKASQQSTKPFLAAALVDAIHRNPLEKIWKQAINRFKNDKNSLAVPLLEVKEGDFQFIFKYSPLPKFVSQQDLMVLLVKLPDTLIKQYLKLPAFVDRLFDEKEGYATFARSLVNVMSLFSINDDSQKRAIVDLAISARPHSENAVKKALNEYLPIPFSEDSQQAADAYLRTIHHLAQVIQEGKDQKNIATYQENIKTVKSKLKKLQENAATVITDSISRKEKEIEQIQSAQRGFQGKIGLLKAQVQRAKKSNLPVLLKVLADTQQELSFMKEKIEELMNRHANFLNTEYAFDGEQKPFVSLQKAMNAYEAELKSLEEQVKKDCQEKAEALFTELSTLSRPREMVNIPELWGMIAKFVAENTLTLDAKSVLQMTWSRTVQSFTHLYKQMIVPTSPLPDDVMKSSIKNVFPLEVRLGTVGGPAAFDQFIDQFYNVILEMKKMKGAPNQKEAEKRARDARREEDEKTGYSKEKELFEREMAAQAEALRSAKALEAERKDSERRLQLLRKDLAIIEEFLKDKKNWDRLEVFGNNIQKIKENLQPFLTHTDAYISNAAREVANDLARLEIQLLDKSLAVIEDSLKNKEAVKGINQAIKRVKKELQPFATHENTGILQEAVAVANRIASVEDLLKKSLSEQSSTAGFFRFFNKLFARTSPTSSRKASSSLSTQVPTPTRRLTAPTPAVAQDLLPVTVKQTVFESEAQLPDDIQSIIGEGGTPPVLGPSTATAIEGHVELHDGQCAIYKLQSGGSFATRLVEGEYDSTPIKWPEDSEGRLEFKGCLELAYAQCIDFMKNSTKKELFISPNNSPEVTKAYVLICQELQINYTIESGTLPVLSDAEKLLAYEVTNRPIFINKELAYSPSQPAALGQTPKEMAALIKLENQRLFIEISDFGKLKKETNPEYLAYLNNGKGLSLFIRQSILSAKDHAAREVLIRYWIETMKECQELKDYSGVEFIHMALTANEIHRLQAAKVQMGSQSFKDFENKYTPSLAKLGDKYNLMKDEMRKTDSSAIPLLTVYAGLGDVVKEHGGLGPAVGGNETTTLTNGSKPSEMRKAELINRKNYLLSLPVTYPAHGVPWKKVSLMCAANLKYESLESERLYQLSLEREPRMPKVSQSAPNLR